MVDLVLFSSFFLFHQTGKLRPTFSSLLKANCDNSVFEWILFYIETDNKNECRSSLKYNFAKSIGQKAKTDKIDAFVIALFGERIQPKLTKVKPKDLQLISDLIAVRAQLLTTSTMFKNRLKRMP